MSRRIGIASLIWASAILLSRVIGLVREAVFGRVVGGGEEADLYFAAFTLPDYLNYLLAAGALSLVFIPMMARRFENDGEPQAWHTFSVVFTFVAALMGVAQVALWFAAPAVLTWMFPGFGDEAQAELLTLTRIVLPAQIFHVLGALLSGTLQSRDQHAIPALAPLLYTLGIIAGGLIGGPEAGARGFAWGVLAGSLVGPFGLPLIGCLRLGLRFRPVIDLRHEDLRGYLWRMLPIMAAFSVVAGDDWMLRSQGSRGAAGTVATLQYAKTLMRVPMGVFGMAVGYAAYPTLVRLVAAEQRAEAWETLCGAIRRMLVLALGAQVVLTAAGADISRVLYGGRLPDAQHEAIGTSLAIMGAALWAWSSQGLLARGFYALDRFWLPSLLGTGIFALALPAYFYAGGLGGPLPLAVVSSLGIGAYTLALGTMLRRAFAAERAEFLPFAARMVLPVGVGIGAAMALDAALDLRSALPGAAGFVLHGAALGTGAGAAYGILLLAVGPPEGRDVAALLKRKLLRR